MRPRHRGARPGASSRAARRRSSPRRSSRRGLAETVAREAGAETAMLDPLEGLTEDEVDGGRGLLLRHAREPRGAPEGPRMHVSPAVELDGGLSSPTGAARPCSTRRRLCGSSEGEFVAIAGPNGGGKTTLVRLVARPRAAGLAVRCASSASRRDAVLAAGHARLPRRSARQLGARRARRRCARSSPPGRLAGRRARSAGCVGRDRERVDEAIERVGLTDRADADAATSLGRPAAAGVHREGARGRAVAARARRADHRGRRRERRRRSATLLARLHARPRRDDPLRLARVRRGRAPCRAPGARARDDRLRRAAVASCPGVWHDPSHVHV